LVKSTVYHALVPIFNGSAEILHIVMVSLMPRSGASRAFDGAPFRHLGGCNAWGMVALGFGLATRRRISTN